MAGKPKTDLHYHANAAHRTTTILAAIMTGNDPDAWIQDGYKTFPIVWSHNRVIQLVHAPPKERLEKTFSTGYWLVAPYVVNGSLSLELHYKTLLDILGIDWSKNTKGHELHHLFRKLPESIRENQANAFSCIVDIVPYLRDFVHMYRKDLPRDFEWKIEYILEKNSLAFSQFRYVSEEFPDSWFIGYYELWTAIEMSIQEACLAEA